MALVQPRRELGNYWRHNEFRVAFEGLYKGTKIYKIIRVANSASLGFWGFKGVGFRGLGLGA